MTWPRSNAGYTAGAAHIDHVLWHNSSFRTVPVIISTEYPHI